MSDFISTNEIERFNDMIMALETEIFGSYMLFAYIGGTLHHSCEGGWDKMHKFKSYAPLDDFAEEMNKATKPVREKLIRRLKQDLANECQRVGASHLNKEPKIDQ